MKAYLYPACTEVTDEQLFSVIPNAPEGETWLAITRDEVTPVEAMAAYVEAGGCSFTWCEKLDALHVDLQYMPDCLHGGAVYFDYLGELVYKDERVKDEPQVYPVNTQLMQLVGYVGMARETYAAILRDKQAKEVAA